MKRVLIWRVILYGNMKTHSLIISSLSIFTIASWTFFLLTFFVMSEDKFKLENSLDNIGIKMDYLNDAVDFLSDEKVFEKEMMENLAYYLPEGFSSRVRFISVTPLDLETGEARVYFTHRHKNYKVDFSYSYSGKNLKVDRESPVELIQ